MTTSPKHDSQSLASVTNKKPSNTQNNLKLLRFSELDAEFTRQSRRLAIMVSKLKRNITKMN